MQTVHESGPTRRVLRQESLQAHTTVLKARKVKIRKGYALPIGPDKKKEGWEALGLPMVFQTVCLTVSKWTILNMLNMTPKS
jgi:hypothetical protein